MDKETTTALRLWVILNRAARSIEEPLRQQVERHNLNMSEFAILEVLLHKGPLPIGEVGNEVLLTSGSMTYLIDKLEKRGLLKRRPCEEDRRIQYAELTNEGQQFINQVFPEHAQLIKNLAAGLNAEEKETASTLLKRLGQYAERHETASE